MNWGLASQIAEIEAGQARRDLRLDDDEYVDVFAALRAASVLAHARPMPRLFGVYLSEANDGPGVLLNASLDIIAQRHTAAHELGHHRMHHDSAYDTELDPAKGWGDGSWPDQEKTAEAFAASFLMPPLLVRTIWETLGSPPIPGPEHVYQTARWMGTSYAGTLRRLARLHLVSSSEARCLAKARPAAIKFQLASVQMKPLRHVHMVGPAFYGRAVHVETDDLVVLQQAGARFGTTVPGVASVLRPLDLLNRDPADVDAVAVTAELNGSRILGIDVPGSCDPASITLVHETRRSGVDSLWDLPDSPRSQA